MKLSIKQITSSSGFTLIELIIYSALLVIISGAIIGFFVQLVDVVDTSRRGRESIDNAKRVLDLINQEVRHADSVYTPTSVAGASPGQLGLETTRDLPTDEENTYVDFYIDDEGLYVRRESQNAELVTSEKVRVSNLVFTILQDANGRQMVRTQVTIEYKDPKPGSGGSNSVSLVSTAATKSY